MLLRLAFGTVLLALTAPLPLCASAAEKSRSDREAREEIWYEERREKREARQEHEAREKMKRERRELRLDRREREFEDRKRAIEDKVGP